MSETDSGISIYNSDIEMIMDFVKLSIIFNDKTQTDSRRTEALNLQKLVLETLPVAQSNRVAQIYSKMQEIYRLNRDSTAIGALDTEMQRLQELNQSVSALKSEGDAAQANTAQANTAQANTAQANANPVTAQSVKQFINPTTAPVHSTSTSYAMSTIRQSINPMSVATNPVQQPQAGFRVINGVKPYQPPPTSGSRTMPMNLPGQPPQPTLASFSHPTQPVSPTRTVMMVSPTNPMNNPSNNPSNNPTVSPQLVRITTRATSPLNSPMVGRLVEHVNSPPHSPVVGRVVSPSASNIFGPSEGGLNRPDRFMIMVGNSAHQEHSRVMPIWDAYKQEVMSNNVPVPLVVRQYDASSEPETVDTLRQKLNLNPITGPAIYRIDLSAGHPRVMRFGQPITLRNLRDFSRFE